LTLLSLQKKKRLTGSTLHRVDQNLQNNSGCDVIAPTLTRPRREAAEEGVARRRRRLSVFLRDRSKSRHGSRSTSVEEQEIVNTWQEISKDDPRAKQICRKMPFIPADLRFFHNTQTGNAWCAGKPVPFTSAAFHPKPLPAPIPSYLFRTPRIKTRQGAVPRSLPNEDATFSEMTEVLGSQETASSDAESDDTEEMFEAIRNPFTGETMDLADHITEFEPHLLYTLPDNFLTMPAFRSKVDLAQESSNADQECIPKKDNAIDLTGDDDEVEITKVVPPAPNSKMGQAFALREAKLALFADQQALGYSDEEVFKLIAEVKREQEENQGPASASSSDHATSLASIQSNATTPDSNSPRQEEEHESAEAMMEKGVEEEGMGQDNVQAICENVAIEENSDQQMEEVEFHEVQAALSETLDAQHDQEIHEEVQDVHDDSAMDLQSDKSHIEQGNRACDTQQGEFVNEECEIQGAPSTSATDPSASTTVDMQGEAFTAVITSNQASEQQSMNASRLAGSSFEDSIMVESDEEDETGPSQTHILSRRIRSSSVLVNRFREEADAEEAEWRAHLQLQMANLQATLSQQDLLSEPERLVYPAPIAPDISMTAEEKENLRLAEGDSDSERDNSMDAMSTKLVQDDQQAGSPVPQDLPVNAVIQLNAPNTSVPALMPPPAFPNPLMARQREDFNVPSTPVPQLAQSSLPNSPAMPSFGSIPHRAVQSHSPECNNPTSPLYVRRWRGLPQRGSDGAQK
jgi:hypothetical protein